MQPIFLEGCSEKIFTMGFTPRAVCVYACPGVRPLHSQLVRVFVRDVGEIFKPLQQGVLDNLRAAVAVLPDDVDCFCWTGYLD